VQHHDAGSPPGTSPRVRLAALAVLVAFLAVTAWLALRPLAVLWVSPANLDPFATIRADLADGPVRAARTLGSGMVRLAPLGVLLPLLARDLGGGRFRSLSRTVAAGAAVSFALEFCQSLVPSRVADVDTVILNTVGVALAHQLAYGPLRLLTGRDGAAAGSRRALRPVPSVPAARRPSRPSGTARRTPVPVRVATEREGRTPARGAALVRLTGGG
jgi:hypothetical protein